MKTDVGSRTSIAAATLRTVHQLLDGEEKLLEDPVIVQLTPTTVREWILGNRYHYFAAESMALRSSIVLRSRYAEDCLKEAYQNGVRQFIVLGAGLDTFAYRQPDWAKDLKILEVDHPLSQQEKLSALESHGIPIPSNVSFLAVDLEQDDLSAKLKGTVIDLDLPVFMSCLGVLVYLSRECIDKIFDFAGRLAKKSEFVFTISHRRDAQPELISSRAAEAGEPWLTHFDPKELLAQLQQIGFGDIHFLSPEEAIATYFENTRIQLAPPRRNSLIRAKI